MILRQIVIRNFRQFLGRQNMEFARDPERNVTLVHGFNGAGKTAFLNAFVWCLYRDTTDDFEEPGQLENEHAFLELEEGGSMEVSVRIDFEDRGRSYVIERSISVRRSEGLPVRSEDVLRVLEGAAGELTSLSGGRNVLQDRINRILSPKLTKFFFFNGERVEGLASADAYEDVEEGVRSMLDIEIYERSIRDLQTGVRAELTNELKKYGGNELEREVDGLNRLVADEDVLRGRYAQLRANVAALEKEREVLVATLGTVAEAQALAEARSRVEGQLKRVRSDLVDADRRLCELLSDDGYLAFGVEVLDVTSAFIADARQRGELPAKIKPQFVDDLLEARVCICGRPLEDGNEGEIERLTEWRRRTGLAAYEEAISLTGAQIEPMRRRRRDYFDRVDAIQQERSALLQSERADQEELSSISARLAGGEGGGDAAALQAMIRAKDERIGGLKTESVLLEADLSANAAAQEAANRTISGLRLVDRKGEIVQRQLAAVSAVIEALQRIYDLQKEDVRADLDARVQDMWRRAAVKDYTASIDDGFRLRLTKRLQGVERPVAGASTGEKQVLALSFVGSLVAKARDNERHAGPDPQPGMPIGGVYPLVMDSPFGSLEADYRAKVADWIPGLASQVVILVSQTQWREEVERAVRPRVGREYILELHSPKAGGGRTIEIEDVALPYVVEDQIAAERTLIREVEL